jgi:hypothetical protein
MSRECTVYPRRDYRALRSQDDFRFLVFVFVSGLFSVHVSISLTLRLQQWSVYPTPHIGNCIVIPK